MTADTENLVLEHLRHIRARVDQIADDMTDLKLRMSGLESGMVLVKREITHGDETAARQQATLDRLAARVERIERRLSAIAEEWKMDLDTAASRIVMQELQRRFGMPGGPKKAA